ncbi:MAG: OmpH family outer membrane protein [Acidobacteria bacterium]|nr:OmpH family outer membrane protein [Acidobacteriota bacterium]
MKKLIIALTILAALSLPAFAQTQVPPSRPASGGAAPASAAPSGGTGAEGKLAYINTARFRTGINEMKEKMDALNTEFDPKRKELEALENDVNNLKNKIQTQGNTVSAQIRNQWVEEGTDKEKKLKRLAEDYDALGQKRQSEVSGPILEKIGKFLESYCQSHGIVMVLEGGAVQQTGVVLYAALASDITEDFMAQYNKAYPGSGAAAPAAKKP